MADRAYEFSWDIIGDIKAGRPNLGQDVNIVLYRLMQYTLRDVIESRLGTEQCDEIYYEAGFLAGKYFFDQFMKDYKDL
ncbi:MAG: hypothetical protein LBN39_07035, partial [Planctomycetaceae bacterium]|nr:hypothetical protein [Planctomycetaceae bacterium]